MRTMVIWLTCCLWPVAACGAEAAEGCPDQAHKPMEKAYCAVDAAGFAAGLPPLREFSKNSERTQRLLLSRPAKKAGVVLPPEAKPKKTATQAAIPVTSKPVIAAETGPSPQVAAPINDVLPCNLQKNAVICGGEPFPLLGNQANALLSPSALTAATQLHLDAYTGSASAHAELMSYLDDAYARYIDAMSTIGLAGSTMSFTKFYHTFLEAQKNGSNFAGRMATMFEFLKKDKKTIAVPTQFTAQRPDNINQCRKLASRFIVCDDVKHNWVYRRAE